MDDEVTRLCRVVSNAIHAGTRHNSRFNYHHVRAVSVAAFGAERVRLLNNLQAETVPTITGSSAEFYIEPMLSCIGDYDLMHYFDQVIAIPARYPPSIFPTSDGNIESLGVYEIHDSGCGISSYVYLAKTSIHRVDARILCVTQNRLSNCMHEYLEQASGPALVHGTVEHFNYPGVYFKSSVSSDFVHSVHCPVWPPQAAEWPQRPRYRGWPDSTTVDLVVSQGCDVVAVSHPCHRDDTDQWRLSFSRAEVILLNSWTPLQQIVYHMMRFFVKTERLTGKATADSVGDRLSNYHVKTLMLWSCELRHPDWWANDRVIQLCRELLYRLGVFLIEAHCDHYFAQNSNLLHYVNMADHQIEYAVHMLISVTDVELAKWFIHNYLIKYAEYGCPTHIQQLLHQIETSAQLESALSAVVKWRNKKFHAESVAKLYWAASDLSDLLTGKITTRTCKIYNAERATIGPLYGVFVAFVFLKCAGEIKTGRCLNGEMLAVLATVAGHEFGFVSDVFKKYDSISTRTLEELMAYGYRCVAAESSDISRQICTELTKAYLHLALIYHDRHANESVHCMASVFLASLYCTTGHYQTAIDCCRVATGRCKNSQNFAANKRQNVLKVDARLLSKCFGDIATVTGFVSLYDYVKRKATSDSQQTKDDKSSFSVKALARFIVAKCHIINEVTAARKNAMLYEAMQHYRSYVVESLDNLFLADVLLFRLVDAICPQFDSQPVFNVSDLEDNPTGYDPNELCEILINLAVERLTTFRQFEVDQFGSNCVVATTEFEALNAYRCRQYDRCLALSRDIIENGKLLMEMMPLIHVDSPQLALMDDDIASIVGLLHLVEHRRPLLPRRATPIAIALYLQIQCLLKLQRPVNFLRDALSRTQIAYQLHDVGESLSRWILAFIYRKATLYLSTFSGRI